VLTLDIAVRLHCSIQTRRSITSVNHVGQSRRSINTFGNRGEVPAALRQVR